MDMDCRASADLIARSLSGNASSQDEDVLRGHLASCGACADLERGLSAAWTLMGRFPAVASRAEAPVVARPFTLGRRVWAAAAAAAAIFVIAAVAYSLRTSPVPASPQAPVARTEPVVPAPEERPASVAVQEPPAAPEKPQPPERVSPVPAVPETKTVAAPEKPSPVPATSEVPERKEPLAKPVRAETRPQEKSVVPAPVPAPAALPVVAFVSRVEGEVQSLLGADRSPVRSGQKLAPGAALETAKGAQVEVLFDDGTRVVLEADSLADSFQAEGGKRLTLKRGLLRARIAKQPAGEPMIFSTSTAEARVLGTRLSLSVTATSTRLEVREGKVRLTRKDDNASVDVSSDHFVVAGKGQSMAPKPIPAKLALYETFDLPRWGGGWLQGGEANLGIRLATENGSLSIKALQKPTQDLGGGKMPSDAAELARKTLQNVNNVASLSRKDWPRSAWLETRQAFAWSNEAPIRIRIRDWNSHHDPDRIVWMALNHGVAGQGLSLERRGDSLQLWVEGGTSPVWKKDAAAPQEWESVELWVSKDQVVLRRNDETLYSGSNPLKIKAAVLSLGTNAKMELAQDEEARFDDVDVFLTTKAELDEVAR
ncbi:MAG TPA: FecR domain-containing protein [Planctomycetota bacterium]|nr:FecR domain-containing protein [Planctomycetota bacterium]